MAEWLRRWTANPLGSAREGSNPSCVGRTFLALTDHCGSLASSEFCSLLAAVLGSIVVSIPACHAGDRGSIPRQGEIYGPLLHKVTSILYCFELEKRLAAVGFEPTPPKRLVP